MIQKVDRLWTSDTEARIFSMFKDKPEKTGLTMGDQIRIQRDVGRYCEQEFRGTGCLVDMLDRVQRSFG